MTGKETLLLTQADIAAAMTLPDYIEAVERVFVRLHAGGMAVPAVQHIPGAGGAFHVKSAGFAGEPSYVAVKVNGNFPDNPRTTGLPTIQGAIVLCDGSNGALLAILDSIEVTAMRTGAATAVAARYLAKQDIRVATVVGCGIQGRVQLLSLANVLPLTTVYAFDIDRARAVEFARQMSSASGLAVVAVDDLAAATRASGAIVTCTTAGQPFLGRQQVSPGTFVAAVGADNRDKHELEPDLLAHSRVVVDLLAQCAEIGELQHALAAGAMTRANVFAELGAIVAAGRTTEPACDDIVIFDSTGSAVQDVAAAGIIYERARALGVGTRLAFA